MRTLIQIGFACALALATSATAQSYSIDWWTVDGGGGAVAGLVGIRVGVVSGVINLESSGVEASDWRLRHDQACHEA